MIFLLCFWALLLGAARIAGAAAIEFTGAGEFLDRPDDRFFAQVWVGLFSIASLLLALSALCPLSPAISLGVLGAIALLLVSRAIRGQALSRPFTGLQYLAMALVFAAVAWDASGLVQLFDTGLYHYQVIRWLHDEGTVRGMALFYYRLGFSSSWFALSAALDAGPWQGRAATVLNGLAVALSTLQLAMACSRVLSRTARKSDAVAAGGLPVVIFLCLVDRWDTAPSPNLAAGMAAVLTGWALAGVRKRSAKDWNLPLLLAAGGAAVKIFGLPLLATVAVMRAIADRRGLATAVLASAVVVAPLPLANRISSGCPFFPSPALCSSGPSAVPASRANDILLETTNFARYDGAYPPTASFFDGVWIRKFVRDPRDMILGAAPLLATAAALFFGAIDAVYIAGAIAFAAMFVEGPSIRFLPGPVGILMGSLLFTLYRRIMAKDAPESHLTARLLPAMAMLGCAILLRETSLSETNYRRGNPTVPAASVAQRVLVPDPILAGPDRWTTARQRHIQYTAPIADSRCWGLALPCTPFPPPDDLDYCDPSSGMRGGFCRVAQRSH